VQLEQVEGKRVHFAVRCRVDVLGGRADVVRAFVRGVISRDIAVRGDLECGDIAGARRIGVRAGDSETQHRPGREDHGVG
jgi:hypothetical protein